MALLGAAVAAAFSSVIGAHGLSWRIFGLGAFCGGAVAAVPQAAPGSVVAACWVSASVASLAAYRERPNAVRMGTPPAVVAAMHGLQLALILFSVTVSLVSPRPRPFVVIFTVCAFGLWRLTAGRCPLSCAEDELRALRGEAPRLQNEIGFIGHHVYRATGILIPRGCVRKLSYAGAAMAFAWYAVQALL